MNGAREKMKGNWWRTPLLRWIARLQQREDQIFLVLTLVIGALTGLAVVAFILLTERLGMRLYPVGSAAWRRLLIPVLGSLGMGYLLFRYFPDARGSGVPQTKAALFARKGVITAATMFGKFFCTAATLASGIPLGREGPSVQVGSGIASVLGRRLGLRPEKVKALMPVGAAAAIAAAFNTPLAAVLFSLEEVMGDLHAPVLGSVVLASATSWAMLRLLLGNNPLFQVPQYQLVHPVELSRLRGARCDRRSGVRRVHKALAQNAGTLPAVPEEDPLVPTRGGRVIGRPDGLVCAAGPGRWLWVCRRSPEWQDGPPIDGIASGPETSGSDDELRFGKRWRHFWPQPVYRGYARRYGRQHRAPVDAGLHRNTRRIRSSRHGHCVCRHCACTYDLGADDL
ncbi:MAG: chloride channel protein [Acidobacteriia bacterium]|nr:chloride channel protein [Terriglobia bacterium]